MYRPEISLQHIDSDAIAIIKKLHSRHYEAYLVGGCVRDLLLNQVPKDFDIATQATPSQIKSLFSNCRLIGKRFRLAHIMMHGKTLEVATFRTNPREATKDVVQTSELLITRDNAFGTAWEDAQRRDFTINGLFYNIQEGKVIDFVNGKEDLLQKKIRTIGDPNIRFREDPIRILRAIRFASKLNFEIEEGTYKALIRYRSELRKSDSARLSEEVFRLLGSGSSFEAFILLKETEVLSFLLPRLTMATKSFPTLLDPYLKSIDRLILLGEKPKISTLLFLLGLPDLYPLVESPNQSYSYQRKMIDTVVSSLAAQISISKKEVKSLLQDITGRSSQIQKIYNLSQQFGLSNQNKLQKNV